MTQKKTTPSRIKDAIARRSFKMAKLSSDAFKSWKTPQIPKTRSGPMALGAFNGHRHEVFLGQCLALTGGLVLPKGSYYAALNIYERELVWRNIIFSKSATPRWPEISNRGATPNLPFSYNYFSASEKNGRYFLPYFAHPQFYRQGIYSKVKDMRDKVRNIRVLFAGTFPEASDNHNLKFPIMPRHDVLRVICDSFPDIISFFPERERNSKIAFFASDVPGDNIYKHQLSVPDYIETVARSDFSINPPGFIMPQSHNVIEALSVGTIPILNYASFMRPRLKHMENCIEFSDADSLKAAIRMTVDMDETTVNNLRRGALSYYDEFVDPWRVGEKIRSELTSEIIINGEQSSVPLMNVDSLRPRD